MQIFKSKALKPKGLEEVDKLRKMIESVNAEKKAKLDSDDALKEMYPKSYMLAKVSELLQAKQGMSDFEIYGGVSEIFGNQTVQDQANSKQRFDVPRKYNLGDL